MANGYIPKYSIPERGVIHFDTTNGQEYETVLTYRSGNAQALFARAIYFSGRPTGIKVDDVTAGVTIASAEDASAYNKLSVYAVLYPDHEIAIKMKLASNTGDKTALYTII